MLSDPLAPLHAALDANDHRAAWHEMARVMMERPTIAHAQAIADAIARVDSGAAGATSIRVALLTDFTAEPLAVSLRARGVTSGLAVDVFVGGFGQWMQQCVSPSSDLRAFRPDVAILGLWPHSACGKLYDEFLALRPTEVDRLVDGTVDDIASAIAGLRSWSGARVLVHSFPPPPSPVLGILDRGRGQGAAFARLNQRVVEVVQGVGDAYVIDVERIVASIGQSQWHDARLWARARMPLTPQAQTALADEYLRYLRAFTGRTRKVLVLDLDDTLWGGVLGEDGIDGLQLGDTYPGNAFVGLQRAVHELHRRGVVLAINSANDEAQARECLATHPAMQLLPEHWSAVRINWRDKAENMIELADELGLGLDSFVFVDNSPVECARMRQALPEVFTVQLDGEPAEFAARLLGLGVFDSLSYGDEDRQRGAMYRDEAARASLRRRVATLDEYLGTLDMTLTIEPATAASLARAAELTQRTNQFNLTTRRFTRDELDAHVKRGGCEAYVVRLEDRLGSQGVIGLCVVEGVGSPTATITDLLVSCRALKRGVEQAVVGFVLRRVQDAGARDLAALFRPTARNAPFRGFYESLGFRADGSGPDGSLRFVRLALPPLEPPVYLKIVTPTGSRA